MPDSAVSRFMELAPQRFIYVIRHDWWNRHPVDEISIRRELELWLCIKPNSGDAEILKIRCFHVIYVRQHTIFHRLEQPLLIGVISIREQQWETYHYAFIDTVTGLELFRCQRFDAWCSFPE